MTFQDLTGSTINTLHVASIEHRHPIAWRCTCNRCGMSQVHSHGRLRSGMALCSNNGCGRTPPKPTISEVDERAIKSAEAEQARQQAIANEIAAARSREGAQSKAEAERNNLLRSGYLKYWNFCMGEAGDGYPISMKTWQRIGSHDRDRILEKVDQGLPFHISINQYESSRTFRTGL